MKDSEQKNSLMITTSDRDVKADELKNTLAEIELEVMTEGITLSKLIREGCGVTTKAVGWGEGDIACTLSAAAIAARARGIV